MKNLTHCMFGNPDLGAHCFHLLFFVILGLVAAYGLYCLIVVKLCDLNYTIHKSKKPIEGGGGGYNRGPINYYSNNDDDGSDIRDDYDSWYWQYEKDKDCY